MKRTLAIVISCLFAATLISVAILLAQVVPSLLIVLAIVVLLAVFGVGAGILITTNTRPSWPDPYALTTDELLRPPLLRDEERRVRPGTIDDRVLTLQRITDMVESAAALRPLSERTSGLFSDEPDDTPTAMFRDPPREDDS